METKGINQQCILVIRKNEQSGKLSTEYLPFEFEFQGQLDSIRRDYFINNSATATDLYKAACRM